MIAGCFNVLLQQLQKQPKCWLPGTDHVLIQINLSAGMGTSARLVISAQPDCIQ